MGTYDYIKYETVCNNCHSKVDNFQSKDGQRKLFRLNPLQVDYFYTHCKKCGCWVEFKRIKDNVYEKIIKEINFKKKVIL